MIKMTVEKETNRAIALQVANVAKSFRLPTERAGQLEECHLQLDKRYSWIQNSARAKGYYLRGEGGGVLWHCW